MPKKVSQTKCWCCEEWFIDKDGEKTKCPYCQTENEIPELCGCGRALENGKCPKEGCTVIK